MSGSWLLVEGAQQAAAASRMSARLPGCRYLATSPAAYAGLGRQGLDAVCLFRYLPRDELNMIARQNQVLAERICSSLDRRLEIADADHAAGFLPFDALLFQLKGLLDALRFRHRELQAFFRSEAPAAFYYWPPTRRSFDRLHQQLASYSQPLSYLSTESAAADLLSAWEGARVAGVQALEREPSADGGSRGEPPGYGPAESLLRVALNFNRLAGLRYLRGRNLGSEAKVGVRLTVLSGSDEILDFLEATSSDPTLGVDWWTELDRDPVSMRTGRVVRVRRRSTVRAAGAPRPVEIRRVVGSVLTEDSGLPQPIAHALDARLTRFAGRRIPQLCELFERVRGYIESRRPAAMLTGTTIGDAVQTLGHACRRAGVPLVSFQHGGNFGYVRLPQLAGSDLKAADIFCAYGAGVRRQLEGHTGRAGRPTVLDLGWPRQGRPYRSRRRRAPKDRRSLHPGTTGPRRPRVMYAATNLMGDRRIGPGYWYDDTAYFLHQVELITVLADFEGIDLTVKLHFKEGAENPLSLYLREAGRAVRIVSERPLPELLPEFDVIVMDWPATTLLEALTRSKPVVYVDLGWLVWYEEAREALRREVHWISRGEGWQEEVESALAACLSSPPAASPGEFAAAYARADYRPRMLLRELSRWSADDG